MNKVTAPRPTHILFARLFTLPLAALFCAGAWVTLATDYDYPHYAITFFTFAIMLALMASATFTNGLKIFSFTYPTARESGDAIVVHYPGWKTIAPLIVFLVGTYITVAIDAFYPSALSPFGDYGTPTPLGWAYIICGFITISYSIVVTPSYTYTVSPDHVELLFRQKASLFGRSKVMHLASTNPTYFFDHESGTKRLHCVTFENMRLHKGTLVHFHSVTPNADGTFSLTWEIPATRGIPRTEIISRLA